MVMLRGQVVLTSQSGAVGGEDRASLLPVLAPSSLQAATPTANATAAIALDANRRPIASTTKLVRPEVLLSRGPRASRGVAIRVEEQWRPSFCSLSLRARGGSAAPPFRFQRARKGCALGRSAVPRNLPHLGEFRMTLPHAHAVRFTSDETCARFVTPTTSNRGGSADPCPSVAGVSRRPRTGPERNDARAIRPSDRSACGARG